MELVNDTINITASFGIMTIPTDNMTFDSSETLYRCADKALYYSKENGRNQATHYNDILNEPDIQINQHT